MTTSTFESDIIAKHVSLVRRTGYISALNPAYGRTTEKNWSLRLYDPRLKRCFWISTGTDHLELARLHVSPLTRKLKAKAKEAWGVTCSTHKGCGCRKGR